MDRSFWLSHPELFEQIGASVGTDVNGDQAETPLLLMAGPVIGQHTFSRHKVATVDLSQVNRTLEHPMDLILGYPTIRQADWLFDFPARRLDRDEHLARPFREHLLHVGVAHEVGQCQQHATRVRHPSGHR
jgi:hypothetical protein